MKSYKRTVAVEQLRQLCRIADFVLLLIALRFQKRVPAFSELRKITFVELGPGPTRLASVKRLFFQRVFFVDQSDFGVPCPELRIADLEQFHDAGKILTDVCGLSLNERVLLFADHCLEHLPENALLAFLESVIDNGSLACFRVPNVLSPTGHRSFLNDSTHRASFDPGLRNNIRQIGFAIYPWMRWYRPRIIMDMLIKRMPIMNKAEEIAICTCRESGTARITPIQR